VKCAPQRFAPFRLLGGDLSIISLCQALMR